MLADAAGEDHGVDPAQGGGERTEFAPDAVAEQIDRLFCFRSVGRQEFAHVRGDPGDAEQARLLVEQAGQCMTVHALLLDQVEQHARIQIAAARAHHQAVEGGEAHARGDAPALPHGAHAGAVAQMEDDHPAVGGLAQMLGQDLGDVFIGQSVEAVAAYPLFRELTRQREQLRQFRLAAMEGGVEAGHLRQSRLQPLERADGVEVVRLVQGRERNQLGEFCQIRFIEQDRLAVMLAAMDHAVTDRSQLQSAVAGEPAQQELERLMVVDAPWQGLVDQTGSGVIDGTHPCAVAGAQAFDLAGQGRAPRDARCQREQRELDRRRTGVEGEQGLGH